MSLNKSDIRVRGAILSYMTYYCSGCASPYVNEPHGPLAEIGAEDVHGGYMVVRVYKPAGGVPLTIEPVCCPDCGTTIHRGIRGIDASA